MTSRVGAVAAVLLVAGCGGEQASPGMPDLSAPSSAARSSDELIEEALQKGLLTEEEALVYRVFAAFGDQRLPAAYRGARVYGGTTLMVEVQNRLEALSEATRATLSPFLLPPSAPGSWIELPTAADARVPSGPTPGGSGGEVGSIRSALTVEWSRVTAQGGKITIWSEDRYEGEAAVAAQVAAEIDARIWDKLFGAELGMQKPAPDNDAEHHGVDGSLDIYLVHLADTAEETVYGVTTASARTHGAGVCGQPLTGAHIQINSRRARGPLLFATVAHELMHASQFTYPGQGACDAWSWWTEATATWAEDFVYPTQNTEQQHYPDFVFNLFNPIDSNFKKGYPSYVFPFFVHRRYGKPTFIRRTWELSTQPRPREAIQTALKEVASASGFTDAWPEFAKLSFNKEPVLDYKSWDGIKVGAAEEEDEAEVIDSRLDGSPINTKVSGLAVRYRRYKLTDRVRKLGLDSQLVEGVTRGAHVWLIPRIDGAWKQPEKLGTEKKYCRDRPGENIQEFVLAISDSEWQDKNHSLPIEGIRLTADFAGCTGFAGTATQQVVQDTVAGPITFDYNLIAGFEPDPMLGEGGYKLTSLSWTFHAFYDLKMQRRPCRTEENAAGILSGGAMGLGDSGQILTQPGPGGGPVYYWGIALLNDSMVTQVTNCNDKRVDVTTMIPFSGAAISSEELRPFEMDGSMVGTRTIAGGGSSKTTTWNFKPVK